ncbi:hypothetical protein [Natrinema versiforme]|uniref:hypothetical protein n=1 Tax=Natrinema versiforme TaxID=88724 RepID=UPI00158621F3|nr:hypothetical protein [Natrinema versiforme]
MCTAYFGGIKASTVSAPTIPHLAGGLEAGRLAGPVAIVKKRQQKTGGIGAARSS